MCTLVEWYAMHNIFLACLYFDGKNMYEHRFLLLFAMKVGLLLMVTVCMKWVGNCNGQQTWSYHIISMCICWATYITQTTSSNAHMNDYSSLWYFECVGIKMAHKAHCKRQWFSWVCIVSRTFFHYLGPAANTQIFEPHHVQYHCPNL